MSYIDVDKYRVNYNLIQTLTENKTPEERLQLISQIAISTNVPIIAIGVYLTEMYGKSPELVDFITRAMRFYSIDEVINGR